jgi:hypothetical protein
MLGALAGGAAAAVAFAIVPPLGSTGLAPHALPGFTIELPPGAIARQTTDYQRGALRLTGVAGTGAAVAITWERGAPSADDLDAAARALEPALGKTPPPQRRRTPGPGGLAVDTLSIDARKGEVRMSFVPCGVRRILVTAAGDGAGALHDRIVPTVACTPVPALEAEPVGLVPIALELPGWFAVDRRVDQLALSDGSATLVIRGRVPPNRALRAALPALLERAGLHAALVPAAGSAGSAGSADPDDAAEVAFTGSLSDRPITGWARRLRCGPQAVILVGFGADPATVDRVAHQASLARCLRDDEAPAAWPDAPR